MSDSEYLIEQEVNERLKFKLKELEDGIKNRIKNYYGSAWGCAFSGDREGSEKQMHYTDAWTELLEVFKKESQMGVPSPHMYAQKINLLKNKSTDDLMNFLDKQLRGTKEYDSKFRLSFQRKIADEFESLLNSKI